MRGTWWLVVVGIIVALQLSRSTNAQTLDLTGYKLTFFDDFDTFSWYNKTSKTGTWMTTYSYGERTLSGNDEAEYYSDITVGVNPFSVSNSILTITADISADPSKTADLPYTSGVITTYPTFNQTYGYFEIRCKLPTGAAMWPAFWMLDDMHVWPPEIDVLEAFGDRPYQMHWAVHSKNNSEGAGNWANVYANTQDSFHNYGVIWTASKVTFYFDDQFVAEAPTPYDNHDPMYLIANLAVGGGWPGYPYEANTWPNHMYIDYIAAYSLDHGNPNVPSRPTYRPSGTAPAAERSSVAAKAGGATTNTITTAVYNGTSANDYFNNNVYGETNVRHGFGGDDAYIISDSRVGIVEYPNGGVDTVRAWSTYMLPPNVENGIVVASFACDLTGNGLANQLTGSKYSENFYGGPGDDFITGGAGKDVFYVQAGHGYDTIADFNSTEDQVVLSGYGFETFAELKAAIEIVNGTAVLTFDNGETLTFLGIGSADAFAEDDFRLAYISTKDADGSDGQDGADGAGPSLTPFFGLIA